MQMIHNFTRLCHLHHGQSISALQSCLNSLCIWFCENGMAFNPNKSVAILFGTPQRLKSLYGLKSVNVAGTVIPLSDKIKILGATLDANLTLATHIKAQSSSCFYHICSFRQICSSLDDSLCHIRTYFFVPGPVELYSVWHFTYGKHTARLQRMQHAVARVVLYQQYRTSPLSSNELLKRLHWLRIEWHTWFKLATLTFRACTRVDHHISLTSCNITNLRDLCTHPVLISFHSPHHSLSFGSRAF